MSAKPKKGVGRVRTSRARGSAARQPAGGVRAQTVEIGATEAVPAGRPSAEAAGALSALAALVGGRPEGPALLARARTIDDPAWFRALVGLAVGGGRSLAPAASSDLRATLDVAIAYALPGAEGQPRGTMADSAASVARLRELRFADGSPVFKPKDPEMLGELADGAFDAFLAGGEFGPATREGLIWRGPRAAAGELEAERLKFIARGRATTEAWGPPCPRCSSRNTVTATAQTKANDEAATETFTCRDCGFSKHT